MTGAKLLWQLWLPVLLFFITMPLVAQQPADERPVYRFRHLNIDLNNNRVETIIQDSRGYIWIGSLGGLHRYDGISSTVYLASDDSLSVSGDRILSLFEDSRKRLWIGTENGVCHYRREQDDFKRYTIERELVKHEYPGPERIEALLETPDGRVWIGSERSGLLYLDEAKSLFVPYKTKHDVLRRAEVVALCAQDDDVIWVGTAHDGLIRLNVLTDEIIQFIHDRANNASLAGNYVENILIDRDNTLWIATREYGLDRLMLNADEYSFVHYKHKRGDKRSLFNDDVTTVYEDKRGNIWVCNENGGLHLYDPIHDSFFRYIPDPADPFSISNISVKVVYEDSQDRLWIGSNLEGVDVIDRYEFRFDHYYQTSDFNSINNNIVRSFLEEEGNLWIATDGGGLNYMNRANGKFNAFVHDPNDATSLSANAVLTVCKDADGLLWIGTWRGGVNVFNPVTKKFQRFMPEVEAISKVFFLMRDRHDNIWMGTQSGGVSKYDWRERKLYTYKNDPDDPLSLAGNDVPVLLEDHAGHVWIGTEFAGVSLLIQEDDNKVSFKRLAHRAGDARSLPSDKVNHLFEDSKKNIWVATEGGLSKLIREDFSFQNYTTAHGLESNHVLSIAEDDRGMLWIGTAKGISRFDPVAGTFRNYTYNDGLQRGEFSRYSVYKTRRGELIFGGTNGFNIFHPDSIRDNPFKPPVYIVGLKIFNKPVSIDGEGVLSKHISVLDEVQLSYRQSVFTFDFIALNYTHPHMNRYAFKMENFENEWNEVGNQNSATYTSLDPGEYVFRVRGSNNDGLWNDEGAAIRVVITPPFWQTAWFKFLGAFLLVTGVYLVVYFRVRNLRKINLELEEKVGERTSQLKDLIDELQKKQEEIKTINDQLDKRVQERTSKLVNANEQLDRFVYSASHDLSAPLKSILGLIHIAKLEQNTSLLYQYLEHMESSVSKLENVIFHLTQFSRNLSPVIQSEFAFKDIVDEVLHDLKYFMSLDNLRIIRKYCERDVIYADFLRLKIILTNLITNAIKYRDRTKTETQISICYKASGDQYIIEVEDNGIGIETKYHDKIFDMFFRGTTSSEGSGLGLFIVKDTVEKLNGHIDLVCEPGIMTRFTITLPAAQQNTVPALVQNR